MVEKIIPGANPMTNYAGIPHDKSDLEVPCSSIIVGALIQTDPSLVQETLKSCIHMTW